MEKRHYPVAIALVALVVSCTFYLNSLIVPAAARPATSAVAELSPERYMNHVTFLARPEMKGRASGSIEKEQSAEYIAAQFRAWGLRPAGDNNTYFQSFEVTTGTEFGPKNELMAGSRELAINDDFVPIAFSHSAEIEGPVAFVGYGITAPELNYDDYAGIDVTDKIVVAFRHEPQELDAHSPFDGTDFTRHASFINKAINARQHGAKGIVFITDPNNHEDEEVGVATRGAESENIGISAVHARSEPIMRLFADAGRDLAAIQSRIDSDLAPQSFDLQGPRIRIATEVIRSRSTVRNVIGAVNGNGMRNDEWLVVGAHYDHVGLGERNSMSPSHRGEIHHGADDNASGTAGMLEMARLAAQHRQSLNRSVLFMAFAAEEIGLLGSSHFVNNPTVPLEKVTAMLNLDMIGRLSNERLFLGGAGTAPEFRPWTEELNESVGLQIDYSDSGYGGSDHMSFSAKQIPALFFFSGLHADYHRPSDTSDKINADGAIKILSLAYLMMDRIANTESPLEYTEVRQARPTGGGGAGGYGAYFGSVPDFQEVEGVLFSDVTPDSPAARAGLRAGDLLVEFDGKPILNLYDFTYALGAKRPGDAVEVVVKRSGEDVQATVTLEQRR